jgi:hypothetical protein
MTAMNGDFSRQGGSLPLILLVLLAGLAGIAGYWTESEPPDSDRYYLRNIGGAVLFGHRAHADMIGRCEGCHHNLLLSDSRHPCSDCHDETMVADDFEHGDLKTIEAHRCEFCHRVNESAQAQSCRNCHRATAKAGPRVVTCSQCHDDDYTPDLLTHDEMQELDGHSCEGCHNPQEIGAVYHQQCNRCHLDENPEKFASENGSAKCQSCHLK